MRSVVRCMAATDLNLVRAFVTVFETGSVTAATQVLALGESFCGK